MTAFEPDAKELSGRGILVSRFGLGPELGGLVAENKFVGALTHGMKFIGRLETASAKANLDKY